MGPLLLVEVSNDLIPLLSVYINHSGIVAIRQNCQMTLFLRIPDSSVLPFFLGVAHIQCIMPARS